MQLTALEIQGFKSFPDRTKINIEHGITAVVGPNGSGKSNISDAVRWVLGETSAKQLRGGGKMENVIFGGTTKRGAMGYAMVNLYVSNLDRRVDVDADEVVIGRRYYRSGDSAYTINGQNVRLKDVYELFLDTGLGRDGYSVIGQGRIAEIVGAKSTERREIFEEASGIAGYRHRKNEAENNLRATEENLVRLRDILGELESRVGPLKKEKEKAERFNQLAAHRKGLEVTLWTDNVHRARETLREQQRNIEIANADYMRVNGEIAEAEAKTEAVRTEIERLIMDSDRLNLEIRAISDEVASADSQIAVLNNDISHNDASIANLQAELARSGEGRESITAEIAAREKSIAECGARRESRAQQAAELTNTLAELQAKSAASGERRGVVTQAISDLTARATELRVQAAGARSAAESAQARLAQAKEESAENAAQLTALAQEQQEAEAFLADALTELEKLNNIRSGLALKSESRARVLAEADTREQTLAREIDAARSRAAMLKELERNMDGYQGGVKTVMKAAREHHLRGVISPVANLLSVKSGYEVAVETALGYALQNIVVEDERAGKAVIQYLKEENKGKRVTVLPLDTMQPGHFNGELTGSAVRASDVVSYDKRYENVVTNLLGRIIVVDDVNEASRVARALNYRSRVVTRDGQVYNAGGSITGGAVSRTVGLFSRRQELEALQEKAAALETQLAEAQQATDKAKAEADALKAELTATDSEIITVGGDKIRGEMEADRVGKALAQHKTACAQLEEECAALTQRVAADEARAQQAAEEEKRLLEQSAVLEKELAALSEGDDSFLTTRARLSDEISELRLQMLSDEKDAENHRAAIETLRARTGDAEQRAAEIAQNIETLTQQNEQHRAAITQVREKTAGSKAEITAREEKIAACAAQRLEKDGEANRQNARVRELTQHRESLSSEMARLSEQKAAKDAEYEQTINQLWETYQLTLSDAEALCVPFESVVELRRSVSEVRGKIKALGIVNPAAIDEYAEVSERYEFQKAQIDDAEQSKNKLLNMIAQLSDEMRTMFTESFTQINQNFSRIFVELFGGGTARLSLTEGEDVLSCGIDIEVAPPGKIIKNLSALSGGEQALVAIAIYFAILAVNPAPFCILDEIEAALDDVNVTRFAQYLRRISEQTQFIVITHRRGTMEEADVLYGVTMQEDGVSKMLRLDVNNVDASMVS